MSDTKAGVKVSVVIPVYNGEKYIGECLDTVLGQTLKEIEVICVDDGSTDDTMKVLKKYAKNDARLIVISQENKNAGAARNNGLKYVAGKYVIFLDADDFFERDLLKKMYERAEEVNAEIVVVNSDAYYEDLKKYGPGEPFVGRMLPKKKVFAGRDVEMLFLAFVGWPWDKLFLTRFVLENNLRFQEQRSTNDLYFVYAGLVRAERITIIAEVLAHHRCNVKTSISMTREKSWSCSHSALIKLKKQLVEWGVYDDKMKRIFANYALCFSLWQLETLSGVARQKFYELFRFKWMKEYDLERERDFFYSDEEYNKLMMIKKCNYVEYCNQMIDDLRGYALELNREVWRLCDEKGGFEKRISELLEQEKELKKEKTQLERAINEIKQSGIYKIGLTIAFVPRKIRSFLTRKGRKKSDILK